MKTLALFLLLCVLIVLPGCFAQPDFSKAKFDNGQIVRTKVGGHVGMVISIRGCVEACYYDVRFDATSSSTSTSLFGADGDIKHKPLAVVDRMREYELEAAQ